MRRCRLCRGSRPATLPSPMSQALQFLITFIMVASSTSCFRDVRKEFDYRLEARSVLSTDGRAEPGRASAKKVRAAPLRPPPFSLGFLASSTSAFSHTADLQTDWQPSLLQYKTCSTPWPAITIRVAYIYYLSDTSICKSSLPYKLVSINYGVVKRFFCILLLSIYCR